MIELICGDGLQWIDDNPRGFVVTDAPKRRICELLALCEDNGVPMVTAYAKKWLMRGKFPGEKEIGPYRAIIRAFPDEFLIVDPFMGSGSTGVAAVLERRDFIGIEIVQGRLNHAERRIKNTLAGITSAELCGIP